VKVQRTVSPVDGSVYVERRLATGKQVESAVEKAVKAQKAWKQIPIAERAAICRRMAEWCVERAG
jgi:acyl-CoA reductase-like NAD-dependent aldehyde dehydrogenase